jgi:hypothetical protein
VKRQVTVLLPISLPVLAQFFLRHGGCSAALPAGELGGRTPARELATAEPGPRGGRTICWASSQSQENRVQALPPACAISPDSHLSIVAARALDGSRPCPTPLERTLDGISAA